MIRYLVSVAVASLFCLQGPALADEVKGFALVKVAPPKKGAVPHMVYAYGTATTTQGATVNTSFQRDGQVSEIYVEVGDQFKKGDPLLDFGASPAAVVAYEQAKTTLALAQHTYDRQLQLLKAQLTTHDNVETAEKAVSDAKLQVEMFEKIGSIKPSEILNAPFDGVVNSIAVSKGDRISAGATLMTLQKVDQIILTVGVEPADLDKVKPDMPVHLTSLQPGRKPIEGTVKRIGASIDPKTRQVPVYIELPPGGALAGENFRAAIEVGQYEGYVVPRDSVGSNPKGTFIYQVDDARAKRVYIHIVGSYGNKTIISGNVDEQSKIMLSGGTQVDDGDGVRPVDASPTDEEENNQED
ncbi:MAG TPA: efflux RND transporter periplasmic adaptor subunit [Xanthobacteraceae bacterium]|jgi:RND family efflux transporter MFP subunit|nr:efflux RND transporter periplasmic adaptor subunit [Xanthobacteraceae bacterium]